MPGNAKSAERLKPYRCPICGRALFNFRPTPELRLEIRCSKCKRVSRIEGLEAGTDKPRVTVLPTVEPGARFRRADQ